MFHLFYILNNNIHFYFIFQNRIFFKVGSFIHKGRILNEYGKLIKTIQSFDEQSNGTIIFAKYLLLWYSTPLI